MATNGSGIDRRKFLKLGAATSGFAIGGGARAEDYSAEAAEVDRSLVPVAIDRLEMAASEQGARRTAMKAASDSAKEMIDSLTLSFNKARQAQITTELLEIVGGAEALK